MNSREAVTHAKKALETTERRLTDARVMRERLERVLSGTVSDALRPSLEDALAKLSAAAPALEREFSECHDILRSLCFVAGLDPKRIHFRSLDGPRGPKKYRDKRRKTSVR